MASDHTREFIAYLKDNMSRLDYGQIVSLCTDNFASVPYSVIDFDNAKFFFGQQQWGGYNVLYRAMRIKDPPGKAHEKVQDISYMPNDKLHLLDWGRANKPGNPMFYGALDWQTACIEAISKGIDFETDESVMLTVGAWCFTGPLSFARLPRSLRYFREFYKLVSYNPFNISEAGIIEANEKLFSQLRDPSGT